MGNNPSNVRELLDAGPAARSMERFRLLMSISNNQPVTGSAARATMWRRHVSIPAGYRHQLGAWQRPTQVPSGPDVVSKGRVSVRGYVRNGSGGGPGIVVQLVALVIIIVIVGVLVRQGYDAAAALSLVGATAALSLEIVRRMFDLSSGDADQSTA
ncbi:hypothetical protein [Parafrankia sp. EUN1f]|uniref:hypothetical protein n=1 Tax=Parafrankia sp. EUN1f TaxID=102897 RepID=UPI0018DB1199|nr:hypothetical protein [Parafrankia sp. EUN1f]